MRPILIVIVGLLCMGCAHTYTGPVTADTDFSHGVRNVPADVITIKVLDASSANGQEISFSADLDHGHHDGYGTGTTKQKDDAFMVLAPKGAMVHFYGRLPGNPLSRAFCGPIEIRRNGKVVNYRLARDRVGPDGVTIYKLSFHGSVQNPNVTGKAPMLNINMSKPDRVPEVVGRYEPGEILRCTYHVD